MPEGLRPDRCRIVFEPLPEKIVLALIPRHYNRAWREKPAVKFIERLLKDGHVVAITIDGGAEKHMVVPKGVDPQDAMNKILDYANQITSSKRPHGGADIRK